ncbi:MAG: luciferase-like protein [Cryptosporangiaceae bacterium]|nr:luciferase-like protein [Cryptosporangiaceae bacterium]
MRIGYFLSCEEFGPRQLVQQAEWAERAGFEGLWISDHYHPWNDAQGQSAFVWSVIGALSARTALPVTTAVTCPTVRIHPAVVAQATATSAVLLSGRFTFGVGSGEALNEHILGDAWPPADIRLDMLEEAVAVIRELWGGENVTHSGTYYEVQNARIYTRPELPPPVYISAFGPKAAALAGRIGDGFVCTKPDAELVGIFRDGGGGTRPAQAGYKVCSGPDAAAARRTAHGLWANEQLPGELAQVLPTPRHFEQASTLVTEEMIGAALVCGNDVDAHVEQFRQYRDAGYDEVYINQIGPDQEAFFAFYAEQVLPQLRKL